MEKEENKLDSEIRRNLDIDEVNDESNRERTISDKCEKESFDGDMYEFENGSSKGLEKKTTEEVSVEESEIVMQTISYDIHDMRYNIAQQVDVDEISEEVDWLLIARNELPIPSPASLTDDETERITALKEGSITDQSEVVTVKFRTDTGETMTSAFKIHSKMNEVKERLSKIFKLNVDDILLFYEGTECDDLVPLSGLGAEPLGTIELGIRSKDPNKILAPEEFSRYIPIVDVITVRVPRDSGGFKDVVVEIENQCFTKKWLGGYRHRITKVEYHHVAIQTLPRRRPSGSLPQHSKKTQTPVFPFKETSVSTNPSKATQILQHGYCFPEIHDKIFTSVPKRFKSKKMFSSLYLIVATVVRIQRFFANFKQRRLQKEQNKRRQLKIKAEKHIQEQHIEPKKAPTYSSNFPLNRDDFYLMYLLMGKWWRREMTKIVEIKENESRKSALLELLQREISLISVIERQRIEAKKESSLKKDLHFLKNSARPIIFRNEKGDVSTIDTLQTQHARKFQEIMSSFLNLKITKDERIKVLGTMKHLMTGYDYCEFTQDILDLLDRECQLLKLGVKDDQLQTLRDRVVQLLFEFLYKYIVNPNSRTIKKPSLLKMDKGLYSCHHCRKLKPGSDFNIHVKMTSFTICKSCEWMKNIGLERIDLTPFSKLLTLVRESEMQNCCYSSVCYILQVPGMTYLTRRIWHSKSILSGSADMNDLRMVRFKKTEDWSPWNCILLTSDESVAHLSIENVYKFYNKQFLDRVHWRHMRARNHFLSLVLYDKFVRQNKLATDVKEADNFLQVNGIENRDDVLLHEGILCKN